MALFDDFPVAAAQPKAGLDPRSRDLVIRTVLGEAANEPDDGMAGVAAVIRNRVDAGRYGGKDAARVVLAPSQFEPWMSQEGRSRMMGYSPDSEPYKRAAAAVDRAFGDERYDPTGGMTHFYSPTAQAALGRNAPSWAVGEGMPIGRHTFFAPEGRVRVAQASTGTKTDAGLFDDFPAAPPSAGAERPPDDRSPTLTDTGGRFTDNPGQNFRTAREGASPTVATKGEAFGSGVVRGTSFNFGDEIKGLAAAGGADVNDAGVMGALTGILSPASLAVNPQAREALGAILKGAVKLAQGDEDARNTYRVTTSQQRAEGERMQEQQPGASIGGEILGALTTAPLTRGANAPTLAGRIGQGAKIGATMGAVGGVGEGTDLQSRATGALGGLVSGGLVGAAAAPVVEGVIQAGRGIAAAARPLTTAIRGAFDPEAEAARRVVSALERDSRAAGGPAGLTPAEFNASRTAGGPAVIADLGGDTTRALARSAANTSPEGRAALNRTINDRFESQSERVTGWLNQTFGPADTGATREALQDAARRANRPAYARAYQDGDVPLWTPELQRLAGSPDVVDAMRAAAEKGKSRAITDGFGGFNSSVQISPTGVVEFAKGKNGQPTYPNLQFWDYTKRALDDAANAARRAGRNDEASVLGQLATGLRNELDANVPSYQAARAGAARFFGANDALEAGERFLTSNAPLNDARRALAQMSTPERDLFREGFVQSLVSKIEGTADRRNVLNSIYQSPRAQQQIEMVMGPQRAREWEAMMRVEGVMDLARGAVQGNSTTARQLTELGLAGGAYGVGAFGGGGISDPSALTTAALVWGAARGKSMIDRRVAQRVGEMLASNDPGVLRRGINIVSRNQGMMNALRTFDQGVARIGGQQAPQPSLPALQSLNPSRAEDQ